jgi:hypothetical protein
MGGKVEECYRDEILGTGIDKITVSYYRLMDPALEPIVETSPFHS